MKKFFKIALLSIVPTLGFSTLIGNTFLADNNDDNIAFIVGVFSVSFALSMAFSSLQLKILDLENQLFELNQKLKEYGKED